MGHHLESWISRHVRELRFLSFLKHDGAAAVGGSGGVVTERFRGFHVVDDEARVQPPCRGSEVVDRGRARRWTEEISGWIPPASSTYSPLEFFFHDSWKRKFFKFSTLPCCISSTRKLSSYIYKYILSWDMYDVVFICGCKVTFTFLLIINCEGKECGWHSQEMLIRKIYSI